MYVVLVLMIVAVLVVVMAVVRVVGGWLGVVEKVSLYVFAWFHLVFNKTSLQTFVY